MKTKFSTNHRPDNLVETVYNTEPGLKHPRRLLSAMLRDLFRSYDLAWRLFVRNISVKYRQSLGGYFWAIFPPLLTSVLWIFLNSHKIFVIKEASSPYPLYVLTGSVFWQVFVNSINVPLVSVKESSVMFTKINFPREAIILASFFEILFALIIQLSLIFLILAIYKVSFHWQMLWIFGGLLGVVSMGMMIGIILTPISILYGDIQKGIPIMLQVLFYMSPIVYPVPESGIGLIISRYNPIYRLIQFLRELLLNNQVIDLKLSLIIILSNLILLFGGWLLYRIAMPYLIERISA